MTTRESNDIHQHLDKGTVDTDGTILNTHFGLIQLSIKVNASFWTPKYFVRSASHKLIRIGSHNSTTHTTLTIAGKTHGFESTHSDFLSRELLMLRVQQQNIHKHSILLLRQDCRIQQ